MDYTNKRKKIEEKFEETKRQLQTIEKAREEKLQELIRIQGEYRLILELEQSTEKPRKK